MSVQPIVKTIVLLAGLWLPAGYAPLAYAANPPKQAISDDARDAVAQMGKTLQAEAFSFQARTLRVYADTNGQPLHIAHSMKVTVHRPDRVLVDLTGDDGSTRMIYDGKTLILFGVDAKKYASFPAPNTIQGMLEQVMGRAGVDFPLSDFLTDSPDKSFLSGVTSGREVNTVTIDGVPCRHLFFTQPPGIELELWVEKNDRSLPRRLIVTYRNLPGQPNYVAEFFDWNFSVHPTDADFIFQPPEGSERIELKPAATVVTKPKGDKR